MAEPAPSPRPARVRTYHARRGRLSSAHHEALDTLAGRWSLAPEGEPLDAVAVFGRKAPLVLEIGCGMGDSTRIHAAREPSTDIVAVDVHTRGVATLLRAIDRDALTNVRVVLGDAVGLVEQRIGPGALSGVRIYFPDPWPKARHAKRRLVQGPFVALLVDRLAPGGFVHLVTDWPDYADQMLAVVDAEPGLENPFAGFAPRMHDRPVTKYERRARRLGHPVHEVWATRRLPA